LAFEESTVELVNDDTEEVVGLSTRVWLKLRVKLVDECGSDGRKQARLSF
jgi:hypothetical protein